MDKQNRRFTLCFRSKLRNSRDDNLSGYHETLDDFLTSAMDQEECTGPCAINHESSVPFSFQLWPHVRKTLHKCSDTMINMFTLLEVPNADIIKLYPKPNTTMELLRQLTSTCTKNFTCNNIAGEMDSTIEITDDNVEDSNSEEKLIKRIEEFAKDLSKLSADDDEIEDDEDAIIVEDGSSVHAENDAKTEFYQELVDHAQE